MGVSTESAGENGWHDKKYECQNLLEEFYFIFFFLGLHLRHMEVPGLGVELELQLQPTPQPRQCQILNPLSKARDPTHILMDTSWVC